MLLFILGLTWWSAAGVDSLIPPNSVFYQHAHISSACGYGNLTVAVIGKVFKPTDCNAHISNTALRNSPFIYINSTNATERFTIIMVDMGPTGNGPDYLQWMVSNVSINTPDLSHMSPINVLAGYEPPLVMHGAAQPTLIRILAFRHANVLRVPFGELWITKRRNFSLSTLFSNTAPNLRLCGPVAGTQFWMHDSSSLTPSAPPIPPHHLPPPVQPVYVPVVPVYPVHPPPQSQPQPQPQPFPQSHPPIHKKSLSVVTQPMHLLLVPLAICTVMFL